MTKQEVLETIRDFSENFPREAIKIIQENRESYISELLDSLDYVYRNANELREERSDYFLHTYAMYLLAEFRERRAFPLLIKLLRLSENEIDYVLGNGLTEGFSRILFSTFDEENIEMLTSVIEENELFEWARLSAINAYGLLVKEGIISNEAGISYLRTLINDKLPSDDSEVVFTAIVGGIIDAKLVELIPEVRLLYDNGKVDEQVYGKYDGFIDSLFWRDRLKPSYIGDTISELGWWACFKKEANERPEINEGSLESILEEIREDAAQKNVVTRKIKKVGRNDPCPCESGKKYKKCCINVKEEEPVSPFEEKYDLLKWYPKDSALFKEQYEKEAIDIDMLVYKALHHRGIPLWVERDWEQERIGKIEFLNEALTLFLDKCQKEKITSFSQYDEQFMIHYPSKEWVLALIQLVEDDDSKEIMVIRQRAEDILKEFSL